MLVRPTIPEGFKPLPNAVALTETDEGVTRAIGRTSLNELRYDFNVNRPSVVEKDRSDECHQVREDIQRKFVGSRVKNRDDFASYIVELMNGRPGATPPVTLFCPEYLSQDENGSLYIQRASCLIAIDGETQLDALWKAVEDAKKNRDEDLANRLANMSIGFVMHAGLSNGDARVIVHDLNTYGRTIKESEIASLNTISPINVIIEECVDAAGYTMKNINRSGQGFGTKYHPFQSSFNHLLEIIAGVHLGPARMTTRTDSFLKSFQSKDSAERLNKVRMTEAVVGYLNLPWNLRRELNPTECRVLGILANRNGVHAVTEAQVHKILSNRKNIHRSVRGAKRLGLLMSGLT